MTTATERQPGFVRTSRGEGKVRTPRSQPQVAVEMIRGGAARGDGTSAAFNEVPLLPAHSLGMLSARSPCLVLTIM